jgi:hypothetical protein
MICPKCGAEYRPGYTSCADCHVFLVNKRPAELRLVEGDHFPDEVADSDSAGLDGEAPVEPGDPNRDPFCSFWKGNDARVCAELCTVLDEAGIPHKTIHRQDHLFNLNHHSPYELGVPASLYEKAELAIKEAFGTDQETGEDTVPLLPAPERDVNDFGPASEEAIAEANEWLGPRYPEDATLEVWSGDDLAAKEMIEMSLQENDVMCRSEVRAGQINVFVLPEDEARAKEIVREIVEAAPPE